MHQWHLQHKRDAKLWGKEVWVALFKRRFRCRQCRKVFTEADPVCGVQETYHRQAQEDGGQAGEGSQGEVGSTGGGDQ